ncbi:MAG TPA: hypothetical protein VGK14_03675 [Novimethylophilus sp.]|jgi:hypothetical protein|uniref:hypothetical protein n=1 Tax=Novimethylophilus sp. TaxID=2137426 RepID=UPI002F4224CF
MSREQVHGVAGILARTRYQRSWPFAGSADVQPHQRSRDTGSQLVPSAITVGRRRDSFYVAEMISEAAA